MNGEDAVNKVKEIGKCKCKKLKAILMDCEMPVKNGFEASIELTTLMNLYKITSILCSSLMISK